MGGKLILNGIEYTAGGSGGGGGSVEDVEVNGTSVVNDGIAEITSYKEVTLSEYNALPSTKLTDGIAYFIKDVGGPDSYPPLIYSDEEREVGVWRDGKPLYQKTIKYDNTSNASISIDVTDLAIDKLIRTDFASLNTSGDQVGGMYYYSSSDMLRSWLTSSNTILRIQRGNSHAISSDAYVTLLYTKTTDTAGSGIWTTQGTYAHHFSNNEQIIGTWTDGKPLYEKTIKFDSLHIRSTEQKLETGLLTVDTLVSAKGTWLRSDGSIEQLPNCHTNTAYTASPNDFNTSDGKINIVVGAMGNAHYLESCTITFQYTKTTD